MTSKLTREQTEDTIEGLEGLISRGIQSVYLDMALSGMRQLLAAMDGEPVAWCGYLFGIDCAANKFADPRRQIMLYRHAQPAQTGVDDDVRNIIGLLETNEWAEHCTETVLGSRLEAEITRLIGCAQPAPVVQIVPEEPPEHLLPKGNSRDATYRRGAAIQAWKQCRAAMLQAGDTVRDLSTPVDPQVAEYEQNVLQAGNSSAAPDGSTVSDNIEPGKYQHAWITWNGGSSPVPAGTRVDVMFRNGIKHLGVVITTEDGWEHVMNSGELWNIVAYRLTTSTN